MKLGGPTAAIRVVSDGPLQKSVEWVSEDGEVSDLMAMHVVKVERVIAPGEMPMTKVTFVARLEELDA